MKQTARFVAALIITVVLSVPIALFRGAAAAGSATMYLSPASGTYQNGSTLSIDIHENSGSTSVNAAQANLTYPASSLNFVSITSSAAFNISAPSSGGGGSVQVARGASPAVTGDQIVATVTFTVTASSGTASISFASGSSVNANDGSGTNILTGTSGGSYTLVAPPASNPPPASPPPASPPTSSPSAPSPSPAPSSKTTPASGSAGSNPAASPASAFEITNVKVSDISYSQATISWQTSIASTSEVHYGLGTSYALSVIDSTMTTNHKLSLPVDAGQLYHFNLKSVAASGKAASSTSMTFHSKGVKLLVSVLDQNNNPVGGAIVYYESLAGSTLLDKIAATTDASGQATLNDLPVGLKKTANLTIKVSYRGVVTLAKVPIQPVSVGGPTQKATIKIKVADRLRAIVITGAAGAGMAAAVAAGLLLRRRTAKMQEINRHVPKLPSDIPPGGVPLATTITPQIEPKNSGPAGAPKPPAPQPEDGASSDNHL